jgi:predicted PurR-regulated permease PerM
MNEQFSDTKRIQNTVLIVLTLGISLLFLWMIHQFLIALFLAAIAAGMFFPLHRALRTRFGGREVPAAGVTVGLTLLLVIAPTTSFLGIVASEAIRVSQASGPWIHEHLSSTAEINRLLERFPKLALLEPFRAQILEKAGAFAGDFGALVVGTLTNAARETALFFFMLFVMLYAMFFFLIGGSAVMKKILYYLPLGSEDENRLVERFLSVSRATLKGTLMIGLLQGALGGLGFWVAGIEGAPLWAAVLSVLSAIPGVGPVLVWLPAVVYLAAIGQWSAAGGLLAWFVGVVGSVDYFLRPRLIGKDTKMPDLLILLGTLGGIVLFGPAGFLIGPIVTALFLTLWDLYGETFKDVLPPVDS